MYEASSVNARGTTAVRSARVVGHDSLGRVLVRFDDEEQVQPCEVLQRGPQELRLDPDDEVLIWVSLDEKHARAVVLGRISDRIPGGPERTEEVEPELSDELVLEAKRELVLRVGEGSITIRADGKILIKGKDLVSHAQRVNRIKGGSVAIN